MFCVSFSSLDFGWTVHPFHQFHLWLLLFHRWLSFGRSFFLTLNWQMSHLNYHRMYFVSKIGAVAMAIDSNCHLLLLQNKSIEMMLKWKMFDTKEDKQIVKMWKEMLLIIDCHSNVSFWNSSNGIFNHIADYLRDEDFCLLQRAIFSFHPKCNSLLKTNFMHLFYLLMCTQ